MATSAKPLFRATNSKVHRAQMSLQGIPASPADELREKHDFYPTPPEPIRGLLALDGDIIRRLGAVWEPAAGDGAICREVEALGLPCIASDLIDRGHPGTEIRSFYDFDRAPAPAVITNPPFQQINAKHGHGRWLRHQLAMAGWEYCALLLSLEWPAARINGLGDLLDNNPFSYCYLMRWKIDFTRRGSPPQRNAWFIWRKGWVEPPMQLRFMNKDAGRNIGQEVIA